MGWGICGRNSKTGVWMGYRFAAICDHPDCMKLIDRSLAYVCGGMHEEGCGGYFCEEHRITNYSDDQYRDFCHNCIKEIEKAEGDVNA